MFGLSASGILTFLGIIFVMVLFYKAFRNDNRQLQNNWSQYFDGMQFSTKEFYERLQNELSSYHVEDLEIETIELKQGNVISSRRLYLQVSWNQFKYDICFANFGTAASFVSWWLWRYPPVPELLIATIPVFGVYINKMLYPETYYRIDSANSFMAFAQSKVLKIIDELSQQQKIEALPKHERFPMKQSLGAI